jgi:hypothetical protein
MILFFSVADLADALVAFVDSEEPLEVQDCDILAVYVSG